MDLGEVRVLWRRKFSDLMEELEFLVLRYGEGMSDEMVADAMEMGYVGYMEEMGRNEFWEEARGRGKAKFRSRVWRELRDKAFSPGNEGLLMLLVRLNLDIEDEVFRGLTDSALSGVMRKASREDKVKLLGALVNGG
jgi:hypothetical protein